MTYDADRWAALVDGSGCPMCAPESGPRVLVELPSGAVTLQDDGDFPGYCILVYRRHVTELHALTPEEAGQLAADLRRLSGAIAAVCDPAKLNYAVLGNEVPHLHCHVIPRYPDDGWWGRPIWARPPAERRAMQPGEHAALSARLRAALDTQTE